MSRLVLPCAALALSLSALTASAGVTISCDRGPLPKVSIINGASERFINSIESTYKVTEAQATAAARYVCADMSAVGDAEKLRALTRAVLANYRRR